MLKCTYFMAIGIQGWSETWFLDGSALATARSPLEALISARLSMCPATVSCLGYRISVVENPAIFTINRSLGVGTYANTRDITNMAVFWNAVTDDYSRRQIVTRGTPDDCVVAGLYAPTSTFATAAVNWAAMILAGGFGIRTQDRSNALFDIQSIDGTGAMITYADNGWDKPDSLKFFRARFSDGKALKKVYRIGTRTDGTHYQLVGWPAGKTATNVKARKLLYVLRRPTSIVQNVAASRKTGRPFGLRAGRRRVTVA